VLDRLLPRSADNDYRGHWLAPWCFGLLVLLKTVIGVNSIWHGYRVASSADGIPLDTFPPAAASTVVSLFALLGIADLVFCAVCLLALVRYRTLLPLLFGLLLTQRLGSRLVHHYLPLATASHPAGSVVALVLIALPVGGLVLSLWQRPAPRLLE
jgi:hypothetical protein